MAFTQKEIKDLNRAMRSNQNVELGTFLSHLDDFSSASGTMALQDSNNISVSGGTLQNISASYNISNGFSDFIFL